MNIKQKFILTTIIIIVILLINAVSTHFFISYNKRINSVLTNINHLHILQQNLTNLEQEYLLFETINEKYFQTQKSQYIADYNKNYQNLTKLLSELSNNKYIQKNNLEMKIASLQYYYERKNVIFSDISKAILKKGFKDEGIIGIMRKNIHHLEETIKDFPNSSFYNEKMLMLRRHEKDYMLRKDLNYTNKFDKLIDSYKDLIKKNPHHKSQQLIQDLIHYQNSFHQLIEVEQNIGYSNQSGLLKDLEEAKSLALPLFNDIQQIIKDNSKRNINRALILLFIFIIISSALIVYLVHRLSKKILSSIDYLKHFITRLGNGELPEKIEIKNKDEIGEMIESVNVLTHNLKNTKHFADEVSKGNFESQIDVFNNKGDLGGSLINMRKQLLKVKQEQEAHQISEQQRHWILTGINQFAAIFRTQDKNVADMAYETLFQLIKYNNALQGGVFLIEKDKNDNEYFNMVACFAYNRKKFLQRTISLKEGLLGACYLEKEYIYLNNLPENYNNITWGLGEIKPKTLLLMPIIHNNNVEGVLELATVHDFYTHQIELIQKVCNDFANTLVMLKINNNTKNLLMQMQTQTESLKAQEEELRQNLEEMQATQEELNRQNNIFKNKEKEYIAIIDDTRQKYEEKLKQYEKLLTHYTKKTDLNHQHDGLVKVEDVYIIN